MKLLYLKRQEKDVKYYEISEYKLENKSMIKLELYKLNEIYFKAYTFNNNKSLFSYL